MSKLKVTFHTDPITGKRHMLATELSKTGKSYDDIEWEYNGIRAHRALALVRYNSIVKPLKNDSKKRKDLIKETGIGTATIHKLFDQYDGNWQSLMPKKNGRPQKVDPIFVEKLQQERKRWNQKGRKFSFRQAQRKFRERMKQISEPMFYRIVNRQGAYQ